MASRTNLAFRSGVEFSTEFNVTALVEGMLGSFWDRNARVVEIQNDAKKMYRH